MSGKTATPTGSALTDTEFFAPLVSAWQPQGDQSTHAAYTASDLMTAEGSATTGVYGYPDVADGKNRLEEEINFSQRFTTALT
jgi:hypothetical protein